MNPTRFLVNSLLATTTGMALPVTALADVVESTYNSSSSYHFRVDSMPDFDQVRDTLDVDSNGDPGGMYCVPVALNNLIGYISTHGYPEAGLPEADWENDEDYDMVTLEIENLAGFAGTDGITGTNHLNGYDALSYILSCRTPGVFTVTQNMATNTTGPTLRSVVENGVNGSITAMGYGSYDYLGQDVWGRTVLDRVGGHYVTFVHGYRNGNTREISFRDPGGNSDSSTQSSFNDANYEVESVNYTEASSLFAAGFLGDRTGSRIMRGNDGKYRMLGAVIHVRPRACYSWESSEKQFKIVWAGLFDGTHDIPTAVPGPQEGPVYDFTIGPFNNSLWYTQPNSQNAIFTVSLNNNETSSYQLPHIGKKIAFAPDHSLLVMGDGVLSRLNPYAQEGPNMPLPNTIQVPGQPEYLAVNDRTRSCWLAGPDGVWQVPMLLDQDPSRYELPMDWPAQNSIMGLAMTGNPEMPVALLGEDGRVSLCKANDDGQLITMEQIWTDGTIASIQFNEEGDLMAFGPQEMTLWRRAQGNWSVTLDHPFANKGITGRSVMAQSRTNYDAEFHGTEGWRQISDDMLALGDLDGDGLIAIDDLLILLANFGSNTGEGDLDDDGTIGIDDLLTLLGNWTA